MNELMVVPQNAGSKRMSSVEIAELMGKKHHHVIRDIKKLIDGEAIGLSNFGQSSYTNAQNKEQPMYLLDFDATMTLITGYDAKRRAMVIKRWRELETQVAAPVDHSALLNDPAVMRSLLLNYTEKVIALETTIAEQEPTVKAYDRMCLADGLLNITNTAKTLQINPNQRLFAYMASHGWIYRRIGGKGWVAYQDRIAQGYMTHKVTTVQTSDGREKIVEQVLVTPKGVAKLAKVFPQVAA